MYKQHTVIGGGGLRLNVMEWGNPEGQPVVLIHGWSQAWTCWLSQDAPVLNNACRLIAPDLRGHGMSAAPTDPESYTNSQLWADDVRAVIDALRLHRPVVAGWSYGGLVLVDYLQAYGDGALGGIHFVGASVRLDDYAPAAPDWSPVFTDNFCGRHLTRPGAQY